MITILLQKILDLLGEHFPEVITLLSKLNLIEEDTEEMRANVDSMKTTLEDVNAQATAAAGSLNQINTTATTINGNVAAIKNNSEAIKNNVMSMSTNVGNISAYSEATANNTLDIDEKITSIASDTTDIRTSNNDIALENSKIYDAVKWLLSDKDISEDASGLNSVSFDTDYSDPLEVLSVEINATQSGSGEPSTNNIRPINGYTELIINSNNTNYIVNLGSSVYFGKIINGYLHLTHELVKITDNILDESIAVFSHTLPYGKYKLNSVSDRTKLLSNVMIASINDNYIWWGFDDEIKFIFCVHNQGAASNLIFKFDNNFSDIQTMKNYLNNNDVFVTLELVDEIIIPVVIPSIPTIKGLNTVSINTNGEINVRYKESIKNYLDKRD